MGHEARKINSYLSNLEIVKKSAGNIFREKPLFCDNGDSLIISCGKSLHIYNTSTGNHLRELFQCSDNIIAYQLHPLQNSQLIIITENGELYEYNLKTNEIEYSIKLTLKQKFLQKQKAPKFNLIGKEGDKTFNWDKQPLDSLEHRKFLYAEVKAFHNNPSEVFVWASWCLNDELYSHLSAFTLKKGKHIKLIHLKNSRLKKCCLNFVLKTVQDLEVCIGMSDDYVNVISFDIQKHSYSVRHYIGHEKTITSLAFHPVECSFATGDSAGRIIIWRNIFSKHPLRDLLHWHTLSVHDLFFSKFGNYLFSGGEENVLVKWSLNSHSKDFLPRLSSAIHHITGTCESSLLSVSTLDNKILVLDYNFEKISTIQHFSKWSVLKGDNKPGIFTVDPRSNCFVLNGRTGHLQFLSLSDGGKLAYTFDVTNRNFITSDSETIIENTEVIHAKFCKGGNWLITVEFRRDKVCKESRLKFWLYCEKQNSFTLNTNVEFPHDDFGINSLEVSPNDMVATTGEDKKFRLWTIIEPADEGFRKSEHWAVYAITKYRNFSCYAIDFSKDASLIAVTFGPILTVWETETCGLKCTLSVPHGKDDLKFCKFGNYELSHLLVTGTKLNISCWNIITLSIIWSVPIKLSLLISDPFSIFMTAFSKDNSLIIFNPSSPNPDIILKEICDSPVAVAHFVTSSSGKLSLYFLTLNQELYCLEDAEKVSSKTYDTSKAFSTPYSIQLAEIQNRDDFDKRKTILVNKSNKKTISSLLDSPAHTLPNPSLLCLDVLKGLLVFSKNLSSDSSPVKVVKNDGAVKINKTPGDCVRVDSDKMEDKLWNIVKTLFV